MCFRFFVFRRSLSLGTFVLVTLNFLRTSIVLYSVVPPSSIPLTGTFHDRQVLHAVRLYSGICS